MATSLKICHIITRMIIGGAQENTLLTIRGLQEKGHDVVLVTGPTTGPEGRLLQEQASKDPRIVEQPHLIRNLHPWHDFLAYRDLLDYLKANSFDIVHTHSSKAGVLGRLAASRAGVPIIIHTVHGQAFHTYQQAWRNWLYIAAERRAAKVSTRIFAVAQAMIDQCVAARVGPAEKYRVVYSGMDLEAFTDTEPDAGLRERLGIPAGAPVIGKVARLFELKGHEYLIDAAPAVVHKFPEVRFLLVGDGQLRAKLEQRIAEKGLSRNFVFAGLVPPHEVPQYIALMDALVHLSLREGLPRTVVQALAAGKPAIAFDLDGTPEVIEDGRTGFLCPPKDVTAVRDAILEILRDPEQRQTMGHLGQTFVSQRFSWQRMVNCIEEQYRECCAMPHEAPRRE